MIPLSELGSPIRSIRGSLWAWRGRIRCRARNVGPQLRRPWLYRTSIRDGGKPGDCSDDDANLHP
jgi:hypothetical protein